MKDVFRCGWWTVLTLLLIIACHLQVSAFIVPRQLRQGLVPTAALNPSFSPQENKPTNEEDKKSTAAADDDHSSNNAIHQLPSFTQVDVIYGSRTSLVYDEKKERFLPTSTIRNELKDIDVQSYKGLRFLSPVVNSRPIRTCRKIVEYHIKPYVSAAFVPKGVTPAYYRYTRWRVVQRFVNANLQVFGTQSLLLGLGIKTKSLAALSAALNWVLKDALGKVVRLIWASKMGGKFDSDAKRWRMRASFLYALGNGMEIACYVFPQIFLLFATSANCCKQMSMLTCSSTRTAIYNSFRDGSRENIGDITAKGEASIAVVDLLGIATGVSLSRAMGTSVGAVLAVYALLQSMEILCIFKMMRSVQFRVLNFERLCQVLNEFIAWDNQQKINPPPVMETTMETTNGASTKQQHTGAIKTPEQMAMTEKILKPPAHLARRTFAFGSLGRARLDPEELTELLDIFSREKFLLVVGKNRKAPRRGFAKNLMRHVYALDNPRIEIQENCHIVLHTEATNADIVKSALALMLLRQKLSSLSMPNVNPDQIRSRDCLDLIRESCQEADRLLPRLLRQLQNSSWTSPARFMFGTVTMRAEWPLPAKVTKKAGSEEKSG